MIKRPKLTSNASDIKLRPLISFALSSHELGQGGDHFQALTPLFAPIVSKNHGKVFSAEDFSKEVQETYGLHINEHVVANFITPMLHKGLLEKTYDTNRHAVHRYAYSLPPTFDNQYKEFESKLSNVFSEYHSFISGMHSLSTTGSLYSTEELEEGLINWILHSDRRFDLSGEYKNSPKSELDFIASEFFQYLEKNNLKLFDDLALLHSGAIISEFVLDYKAPTCPRKKVTDLSIVLDAPLVMNLLNLSGEQQHLTSMSMLKQLKHLGVRLHIFKHSCEEIEDNIDGVLSPSNKEKYGSLATAISSKNIIVEFVKMIRKDLEQHIAELGIKVFDIDSYGEQTHRLKYFPDNQKDRLYGCIPRPPEKRIAQKRDVESIAAIIRWRSGHKSQDFLKSKYLFITNNKTLARQTRDFCTKEALIKPMQAPPAISIETLSGILFLTLGDFEERVSLSRKQLLSSCAKIAIIKPEMIERLSQKLSELSPAHDSQIEALLKEPKTAQLMLNLTWGNSENITQDNVEEVIQAAIDDISEKETKKYKSKLKDTHEQNTALANDNKKLNKEKREMTQHLIQKKITNINELMLAFKIVITLILFTTPLLLNLAPHIAITGSIITSSLSIYPLWFQPNILSKKVHDWKKRSVKKSLLLNRINLDKSTFQVDYNTGKISIRGDKLI